MENGTREKTRTGKRFPSRPKCRYTIAINELDNADPNLNEPLGVPVKAIVYGGRDSAPVPIARSLTWEHGVFLGATVESETTAATIGKEGVRTHDPMANKDFISVPLATYLENHIKFTQRMDEAPTIFATNYFLNNAEGK